jgi:hypothetical protein
MENVAENGMLEEWKDVVGYEGLYEVSNTGKVRSLDRIVFQKNMYKTIKRIYPGRLLSQKKDEYGYYDVGLSKNGKIRTYRTHRIVAQAFIPNEKNLPQVNHKDENPSNNHADNLEWCTAKYNVNYGTRTERMSKTNTGRKFSEERKRHISESLKGKRAGASNNMFGKHHSEEAKQKIREKAIAQWIRQKEAGKCLKTSQSS